MTIKTLLLREFAELSGHPQALAIRENHIQLYDILGGLRWFFISPSNFVQACRAGLAGHWFAKCYNGSILKLARACVSFLFAQTYEFRRGVAQPGRAPGSGPGGRRFKSSLPDQFFSRSFDCLDSLGFPRVLGHL